MCVYEKCACARVTMQLQQQREGRRGEICGHTNRTRICRACYAALVFHKRAQMIGSERWLIAGENNGTRSVMVRCECNAATYRGGKTLAGFMIDGDGHRPVQP